MQADTQQIKKCSRPPKGKWQALRSFSFAALIIAVQIAAISAVAEEDAVAAFKKHLSSPPSFSRIIYSEASCNGTIARTNYAGYCGDSFFLQGNSLFVGRVGDARWQIAGSRLTISEHPDPAQPDPYAGMSDDMRSLVGGIVSLTTSQYVVPGSFVWNGNHFKCKGVLTGAGRIPEFEGEITVEGGVVTKMLARGAGVWTYRYSKSNNLPFGIPSEITMVGRDSPCVSKVIIHEMVPVDPADELLIFAPERFCDTNFMTLKKLSLSKVVSLSTEPHALTQLEDDELKLRLEKAARAAAQRSRKRTILLIVCVVVLVVVPATFMLRNKRNAK